MHLKRRKVHIATITESQQAGMCLVKAEALAWVQTAHSGIVKLE